ncbi:MAG: endonuclease/exonuclease/phosphatase family protein [Pseudomonadota bacterium]|nr:endonuclease/exonuclease/phosphatase family protein [Pseudomonadota bacterium]
MTTRRHRIRAVLASRLALLSGLCLLGASLPWWQAWVPTATGRWLADLAVHWQWPYLWLGAVFTVLWLVLAQGRARPWAAATLAALLPLEALNLGELPLARLPQASGDAAGAIKLIGFNVNLDNRAPTDVLRWIEREQPGVLALMEVTPAMQPLLAALAARYPHAALSPRHDPFGMAVFSRHAWTGASFVDDGQTPQRFVAEVQLQAPDRVFTLHVIHPMPPISVADHAARDALLARMADAAAEGRAAVLMGDFNTSPWGTGWRPLIDAGWARATGLAPTFALGRSLPIDHILATRAHWRLVRAGTGPWLGSDHRPVWALLQPVAPTKPQRKIPP